MRNVDPSLEELVKTVVDHGFRLHDVIGPGLLEGAYEAFLEASLRKAGLSVERQVSFPARYGDITIENAFRVDLLVERGLVVELKSVEPLSKVHTKQVLTYLRLLNLPIGLLMNFGAPMFRDGIKRIIDSRHPYRSTESQADSG